MKQSVESMTLEQVYRELESYAWNYIVAADKAPTDAEYDRVCDALDRRHIQLLARKHPGYVAALASGAESEVTK